MEFNFDVKTKMHCGKCTGTVEKALRGVDGVVSATADVQTQTAKVLVTVAAAEAASGSMASILIEAIEDVGFEAELSSGAAAASATTTTGTSKGGCCGSKAKKKSTSKGDCGDKGTQCSAGGSDRPGKPKPRTYYRLAFYVGAVALAVSYCFSVVGDDGGSDAISFFLNVGNRGYKVVFPLVFLVSLN